MTLIRYTGLALGVSLCATVIGSIVIGCLIDRASIRELCQFLWMLASLALGVIAAHEAWEQDSARNTKGKRK